MKLGLAAWHRAVVAGWPEDQLTDIVAADAVLHSPFAHAPQTGRDKVVLHLVAAGRVLAGSDFTYVRELVDGSEAFLAFEAVVEGLPLAGIDLIRFDLEGRIAEVSTTMRPLKAIEVLWRKMEVALENT